VILLCELIADYLSERSVSAKYRAAHLAIDRELSAFFARPFRTRHFQAEPVNRWISYLESRWKPATVQKKKTIVGTLWRYANDRGLAEPIGRLRKIKVPRTDPEALTIGEVQAILASADKLRGCIQRTVTPRRIYWRSLYLAYWDTALRISDLRSIERTWIWPNGYISIVQSKVQRSHRVLLRPETIAAIDELMAGRTTGPIWSALNEQNFYRAQRKLFALAGVRGSGKWIRRASASYVERERPGTGWRHLGHAAPGLAERFYLDPSIVSPQPSLPPHLEG
jgi:integrase